MTIFDDVILMTSYSQFLRP